MSCGKLCDNEIRPQLRVLAYTVSQFIWMLALLKEVESRRLTTLRKKQNKIGAKMDL